MPSLKFYQDGQWWDISGFDIHFITVGTTGVDGVDSELANNPHPYATGDSPGPVPFDNGTQAGGSTPSVAFAELGSQGLLIVGGFTGVTAGQSIFTLPAEFRPLKDHPIVFLFNDFSALAAALVQSDGQVIYEGSSAVVFT